MIRAEVTKGGAVTNQAYFATQELADAWLAQEEANKSFGKPERWVYENDLLAQGEDIANSVEMVLEQQLGQEVKKYKFPSQYITSTVDVTAETLAAKKLSDRAKKRAFGEGMIDKISTINDSKELTTEQVDAFMSNALISSLREHLWAGNISTFISKLTASDVSAFFSSGEKAAVIAECEAFLTSLEG